MTGDGRVLVHVREDATGRAVAGASVEVWTAAGFLEPGTTDAHGRLERGGFGDGWVGARARADGFAPSEPNFQTTAAGLTAPLHVLLQRGIPADGRVVDRRDGRPLAGVQVLAFRASRLMRGVEVPFDAAVTDGEGRFRFSALPMDEEARHCAVLTIAHAEFERSDTVVAISPHSPSAPHVRIGLSPGGRLRGRVHGPAGEPVREASVHVHGGFFHSRPGTSMSHRTGGAGGHEIRRPHRATSRDDGTFEVACLPLEMKLLVEASGPGNAASEVVEVAALTAESREADVDVRLGAAGRIVVRVTDREHRPVDVPSAASISGGEFHASAQSDTDGTIAVAGVPPGRCFVFVEAEGFCSAGFSVQVRAGRTTRRTARLDRAQTVEGRIVDDLGTPVAGARVWAHEGTSAADDWEAPGAVDADADGRFRIERLEPSSHRLIARTPRHPLAILRGVRPPASDLRVVLPRGVTLRGRFILPAGAPPPDAWFVATAPWRRRGDRPHEWHAQRLWWHGDAFDVPGVPAGDTDFRVRVPGFAGLRQRIRAVPGEVLDLGDVVLDRGVELTGRVVLPDGSPVEGARVGLVSEIASFEHAEAWLNETLTGADGSFRIPGLTPGELELRVSRHGGIAGMFEPQFTLRVTADATPAILTYDPTHVPPEIAELSSRLAGRTVTPGAAPRRRRSAPRRRR